MGQVSTFSMSRNSAASVVFLLRYRLYRRTRGSYLDPKKRPEKSCMQCTFVLEDSAEWRYFFMHGKDRMVCMKLLDAGLKIHACQFEGSVCSPLDSRRRDQIPY